MTVSSCHSAPAWRAWRIGFAIAILLLTSGLASADEATTAAVRIRLAAPPPLTASVVMIPDTGGGRAARRQWTAAMDRARTATIHRLPPGAYLVTVNFSNGTRGNARIVLAAGSIVTLNAIPAEPGASGRLDVVDQGERGQGVTFLSSDLRNLPDSADVSSFLDAVDPFVISSVLDGGGLAAGRTALVGNRGSSWTLTNVMFGDINIGPPNARGVLPFYPDLAATDSVRVYSGGMPPDDGTPGATIALAPRRPGPAPAGSIDASATTAGMVSTNDQTGPPAIARMLSWQDLNLQGGGPIGAKFGAFVSATATRARHEERGDGVPLTASIASLFGHLVGNPTDHDEVRVLAAGEKITRPFDDRLAFADTSVREHDTFVQSNVTWDHAGTDGSEQALSAGFSQSAVTPLVLSSAAGGTMDRVFDGVIPPPAAVDHLQRINARADYEPGSAKGLGDIRFTASFERVSATSHVIALPTVAELVDGIPARLWVPGAAPGDSDRHVTTAFAAVSDALAVSPHLTFNLGLRADMSSGSAKGAAGGATWRTLQPRLSFRFAEGGVAFFGNAARYAPELTPDLLAFGDPGEPSISVYAWNDANGNRVFDSGETGPLIAVAGRNPGVAAIDPGLHAPHTNEFTLGLEGWLTGQMRLRFTAIVRNERQLIEPLNVGVPLSGYTTVFLPSQGAPDHVAITIPIYDRLPATFGQDQYLLTNIPDDRGRYRGLELFWDMRSTHWYSTAGASAFLSEGPGGDVGFGVFENDQGVIGSGFADPNAALVSGGGHLFFDRSYVLKWSTTYQSAGGFLFSVIARYQDGQPFARLIIAPDLAQGAEAIPVSQSGSTRFTFNATADVRIEQRFKWGRRSAAIRADIFNVTNRANEIEEDPVAGASFRDTTAVQPPRTVRLGFRLEF